MLCLQLHWVEQVQPRLASYDADLQQQPHKLAATIIAAMIMTAQQTGMQSFSCISTPLPCLEAAACGAAQTEAEGTLPVTHTLQGGCKEAGPHLVGAL